MRFAESNLFGDYVAPISVMMAAWFVTIWFWLVAGLVKAAELLGLGCALAVGWSASGSGWVIANPAAMC